MSTPFRWLPFITTVAASGALGAIIGFTIENWHELRAADSLPSRWFCNFQLFWSNYVTREWQALAPLLEDDADLGVSSPVEVGNPSIRCQVCHDLVYESPHRYSSPGTWRTRGSGWYDYLVEDLSCPYPRTSEWIASAIKGCISCQLVVDAVSAYAPQIFQGYTPGLDDYGISPTHIRAWGSLGKPLAVSICRPWVPWTSEREEYLEVFTKVGSPLCWPTVGSAYPVCPDNRGSQAIEKITRWLNACDCQHSQCYQRNSHFQPKRLIEISDTGQIRLVEPKGPCKYVALSYCWGNTSDGWLTTVSSNVEEHMQSIDVKHLPQGLADAIIFAKALKYQRIWIDALCIIQDDKMDLETELVRMGLLYACADLVIGIDTIKDCTHSFHKNHAFAGSIYFGDKGCLFKKTFQSSFRFKRSMAGGLNSQRPYEPYFLKLTQETATTTGQQVERGAVFIEEGAYTPQNVHGIVPQPRLSRPCSEGPLMSSPPKKTKSGLEDNESQTVYVRESRLASHENSSIKRAWRHLDTRGWTLQESRLARRLLTLGVAEMKWTCVESSFCECWESINAFKRDDSFAKGSPADFRRKEIVKQRLQNKERDLFSALTSHEHVKVRHSDLFEAWELLIEEYSRRKISKTADRLPAISGISSLFDRNISCLNFPETSMLAGLWKDNLLKGMLWRSRTDTEVNTPELFYSRSIPVPENTPVDPDMLLRHLRLNSLFENHLVFHAYVGGKACFANTIYWPLIQQKRKFGPPWPTEYFPSWSWVSVFSTVTYWNWQHGNPETLELYGISQLRFTPDALIREAYTWSSSQWPEGITAGKIRLYSRTAAVKLKSVVHGVRKPTIDFCELYRMVKLDQDERILPILISPLLDDFTHFATLPSASSLLLFLPDTPCVFGANEPSKDTTTANSNQWLIDLIKEEYQLREKSKTQESLNKDIGAPTKTESPDMDADFHKFMPCLPSQSAQVLKSETLCSDDNCGCKKRWTDPATYPAVAAYIGAYYADGESGRRTVHRFSLILMPSVHNENVYHRIGIAISAQCPSQPGYCDPFKDAEWKELAII